MSTGTYFMILGGLIVVSLGSGILGYRHYLKELKHGKPMTLMQLYRDNLPGGHTDVR